MAQDSLARALRTSYVISGVVAVVLAGGFFAGTTLAGGYNALARYGGAAWIFLLALIVGLPTITPIIKRKNQA